MLPLAEHRTLVAADLLHRDAGRGRDLLGGLPGADPRLDLPRAQLALQLDLQLPEPRPVVTHGGAQGIVEGQLVLDATRTGVDEHEAPAVLAHGDEPQLLHAGASLGVYT